MGTIQGSPEHSRICRNILEHLSHCTVAEATQAIRAVDDSLKLLLEVNKSCMHAETLGDHHTPESNPKATCTSERMSGNSTRPPCETQPNHKELSAAAQACEPHQVRMLAAQGGSTVDVDGTAAESQTHMHAMHVSSVAEPVRCTPQDILKTMCSSRSAGSWDPMLTHMMTSAALTTGESPPQIPLQCLIVLQAVAATCCLMYCTFYRGYFSSMHCASFNRMCIALKAEFRL